VSLGDALEQLAAPDAPSAGSSIVVTFDDGTADFVDEALPILVRHRVPATLYVATDFVEHEHEFPAGGKPVSWAALRDACATGFVSVGSHTDTHRLFDRISEADAARELDCSIELIGDRLGRPALDFAYPKAVPGPPEIARLVRDRFRSAALAGTRVNPWRATDPYRLARSPIQVSDGMQFFDRKLAGGMTLEDSLRRTLNRVRYAKAAT
jgi:peptidoglycan/xylan/chitin deacetylase (PgdA/CDA1 family)